MENEFTEDKHVAAEYEWDCTGVIADSAGNEWNYKATVTYDDAGRAIHVEAFFDDNEAPEELDALARKDARRQWREQ